MSKDALDEWDTTAANNTDIGGITLAESVMLPSQVNNAFRELMSQLATAQTDATFAAPFPTGHLYGLTLANNGSDATNDIDIAAGSARDAADTDNMVLGSALTKRLDANWAVGTNQGGLDTGSKANSTWYYVWLIKRADTGVVDVLFSASASSPTMPANYTIKRLVGFFRTDGSAAIEAFTQIGDDYVWGVHKGATVSLATTNLTSCNAAVPPIAGIEAWISGRAVNTGAGFSMWIASGSVVDVAAGIAEANRVDMADVQANEYGEFQKSVLVNSGGAFSARTNVATVALVYSTERFRFDRRRL